MVNYTVLVYASMPSFDSVRCLRNIKSACEYGQNFIENKDSAKFSFKSLPIIGDSKYSKSEFNSFPLPILKRKASGYYKSLFLLTGPMY